MSEIMFRPMTFEEYQKYKSRSVKDYANQMLKEGQCQTFEEAIQKSLSDYNELLPYGLDTPDNYLYIIQNADKEDIGYLLYETTNKKRAFIEDFLIYPAYRRQGYGFKALKKLEADLIEKGIYRIVLHVFESNSIARRLYEKSGFTYLDVKDAEPGSLYMVKVLDN